MAVRQLRRLQTLVIDDGVVEQVFYPVFPPDRATADVVTWLRGHPRDDGAFQGVTIYTMADCQYCRAAKTFLQDKSIPFAEVDIGRDVAAADVMVARSGRTTVPQVFIGARHVGGSDDLLALGRTGELDRLVAAGQH